MSLHPHLHSPPSPPPHTAAASRLSVAELSEFHPPASCSRSMACRSWQRASPVDLGILGTSCCQLVRAATRNAISPAASVQLTSRLPINTEGRIW